MPLYGMLLDNMPRIYLKDLYPFTINTSNQVRLHEISNVHLNNLPFLYLGPGSPFSPSCEQTEDQAALLARYFQTFASVSSYPDRYQKSPTSSYLQRFFFFHFPLFCSAFQFCRTHSPTSLPHLSASAL